MKKISLLAAGALSLIILSAGCANQAATPTTTPAQDTAAEKTTYQNETLGISFAYPKSWGEIHQVLSGTNHVGLSTTDKMIFLAVDTGGPGGIGRGGYWGDDASKILDQKFIDTYCKTQKKCETKVTSSGITFAKSTEEAKSPSVGTPPMEIYYHFYNPTSKFRGVMLSADSLSTPDAEKQMEQIVDSLRFIGTKSLLGALIYNCALSGGTFKNGNCACALEAGQTQADMYDTGTGFCQASAGGAAGNAFYASRGLPFGEYDFYNTIITNLCIKSGGTKSGAACICPSKNTYSTTTGRCLSQDVPGGGDQ